MDKSFEPLVTIVIPAWNAQDEIEASVRSALGQSHRNLRVLVADDGSTDRTGEILDGLAREDGRLQVLHLSNGGPAAARNRALDRLPEGTDYVMFQDADDRLAPDTVAYALSGTARGAELVIFGFAIREQDGSLRAYCEPRQELDRETLGRTLGKLYKANLLNQVWGKLYAVRLLRDCGIRFPDYRWGEDRLFVFQALRQTKGVSVLPEWKYEYIMHRGESLITRYYDRKFPVSCEIDRQTQALCRELGVEDDGDFRYMFAKSVFSCLTNLYAASCPLDGAGKRAAARRILEEPQVRQRLGDVPGGLSVKLLSAVVRSGNVGLNLLTFRTVTAVSRLAPGLVIRIKHRK